MKLFNFIASLINLFFMGVAAYCMYHTVFDDAYEVVGSAALLTLTATATIQFGVNIIDFVVYQIFKAIRKVKGLPA